MDIDCELCAHSMNSIQEVDSAQKMKEKLDSLNYLPEEHELHFSVQSVVECMVAFKICTPKHVSSGIFNPFKAIQSACSSDLSECFSVFRSATLGFVEQPTKDDDQETKALFQQVMMVMDFFDISLKFALKESSVIQCVLHQE